MYKTVSNTNININILFDHRLTCRKKCVCVWGGGGGGGGVMIFSRCIDE